MRKVSKKLILVLLLMIISVINTTAFATTQDVKPASNSDAQQNLLPPPPKIELMDSDELFNQIKDAVINRKETALDELEQEKYNDLEYVKDHITEEERIILAKMMAYRQREAERVAQATNEYISSISSSLPSSY